MARLLAFASLLVPSPGLSGLGGQGDWSVSPSVWLRWPRRLGHFGTTVRAVFQINEQISQVWAKPGQAHLCTDSLLGELGLTFKVTKGSILLLKPPFTHQIHLTPKPSNPFYSSKPLPQRDPKARPNETDAPSTCRCFHRFRCGGIEGGPT